MGQDGFTIDEIVHRLERRAAGDPAALDPVWAPESVSWRSYSGQETTMTAAQRCALARSEIESFVAAMPDFRRESSFHPSRSTGVIVEFSTWTGTRDGVRVHVEVCFSYWLDGGRIKRLGMYADAGQLKVLGEVLASARAA